MRGTCADAEADDADDADGKGLLVTAAPSAETSSFARTRAGWRLSRDSSKLKARLASVAVPGDK
jgi:hypothetical protein